MMPRQVTIHIAQNLGTGICVTAQDGQKIYEIIHRELSRGNRICLSFSSITRLTTAFLNAAIGQLYGEFSEEFIRKHMAPPVDSEPWQLSRLKIVVDRAKIYFSQQFVEDV